jgi:hypothetical protein
MILFSERTIKNYQSVNSQGNLGVFQSASKQRWPTGSRSQKFTIVMWQLMNIQKGKSWNKLKLKQRSASQSHVQTFRTIVNQNIPVRLAEDWFTPSFEVTATT